MNIFQSVTKMVTDAGGAIAGAASQTGQAVVGTATGVGGAIAGAASQTGQAVMGTAVATGEAVGSAASQTGKIVVETSVSVGGAISGTAVQATQAVGYAVAFLGNNPQFQELTKSLQVDWLVKLIDQVDVVKAETEVRRLQQQYPNEQPSEIAHRLMVDKALLAGGSGLASSLVPGAAALFVVDLATTMLLQAEMVYQIACAYGLDLQDPARKGEVLAIFGLSLGCSEALKVGVSYAASAGLGFLVGSKYGIIHRSSHLDLDVKLSPHPVPDVLGLRLCPCGCNRDSFREWLKGYCFSNYYVCHRHDGVVPFLH